MRELIKWRAPKKSEMWFGCEETPVESKVMRTSIVAVGASTDLPFMGFVRLGAKAEERRVAILVLSQGVVMLSGNSLWWWKKHRSVSGQKWMRGRRGK